MNYIEVHEIIRENAKGKPHNIAVEFGDEKLTYSELEHESDRLASFFIENITESQNIVVMMDKGIDLIKSIIAIMKSGNVFVPLNPSFPTIRLSNIIDEVKSNWIIAEDIDLSALEEIAKISGKKLNILLLNKSNIEDHGYNNLSLYHIGKIADKLSVVETRKNKHAYIYFTSGSTGRPKGILGRHRSLSHFIDWEIKEFGVDEGFRVSQLTPPTFDPFLRDIFVPLCAGGTVCIPRNKDTILDGSKLIEWIDNNRITLMHMVPTLFRSISNSLIDYDVFKSLKYILLAGELLRGNDIKNFIQGFGCKVQLVNLYGPTETTLAKFFYRISPGDENKSSIPVGKPISMAELMILDEGYNLCALGSVGEIYIRTPFISSGYVNNPELTKEVFIRNPFSNNPGDIVYKTGDLGYVIDDGNLEIIGRIDHQVKIRGFRIELGEVENRLLCHESIKEAVVVAKEDKSGDKYLYAYIIGERELTAGELREHIGKELPEYMIPSYFMQLEKLPLNANGKVDRKALPEIDGQVEIGAEYEAPRNEIEAKLVEIWREVLRVEKIGINDSFFALGGHSLKAMSMAAKIHKELNVEVPLREIFKTSTIKGLGEYIKSIEKSIYEGIEKVEERECYELSPAQKRLYTLQQFDMESIAYNIPKSFVIEGKLEEERLNEAFKRLIERHESLRTSFELEGEEIVQRIHKEVTFEIESKEAKSDNELSAEEIEEIVKGFTRAFELNKAPLLRVGLIKVCSQKHILIVDMHHIISDGASIGILVEELIKEYKCKELTEVRIQYKDYAAWQNKLMKSDEIKKQEEYWLEQFKGEIPILNLATDYTRPIMQSFEGDRVKFKLGEEITEGIRKICKETGTTMYMVLLAGFNVLLSKYSGQEEIIVGSPIAGRPHADLENTIGMFVNTLAMRNYPDGNKSFKEFLKEVKINAIKAYENQDYQFEELVEKLNIRRDMSRNPVFDVMLVLQNTDVREIDVEELKFKSYSREGKVSKFDLTIEAMETNNDLTIYIEYCTRLFNKKTMERFSEHFTKTFREIVKNIDGKIKEIEIVTEKDKMLLNEFNDTKTEYPKDKTIQELFEEQVKKTPDKIAAVYEDKKLTYTELDEKANSLARVLRAKGVEAGSIVGIMVERSLEVLVGIIGILKAGGAYMPIDPGYPEDRTRYMLEDSDATILLTQSHLEWKTEFRGQTIYLDEEYIYKGDKRNLEKVSRPNDLAYIIYTSGSTGKPKGVMIEHHGVLRLVKNTNYISFSKEDKILQTGSIVFDASTFEIWGVLLNGLELHLINEYLTLDANYLEKYIALNKITILWLTSALFNQLSQQNLEIFKPLKYLLAGGDVLSAKHINNVKRKFKDIKVINGYGPTENTTFTTCYTIEELHQDNVPIGKPISNTRIYIVDKYNNLQPIGVPGELCISGDGLARGYLNMAELTAEKFVANPFESGERMYKTGDLARWMPDGNIEFLGRIDYQVKIRGFRVELGEIENRLLNHTDIKEAAALAKGDECGNKYLCAYIVSDKALMVEELREYLGRSLPEYMIPTYFMQLEKMPLNANGKINRKELPEIDGQVETGAEYETPRNEIEARLVKVWEEVLKVDKIGINDNFFALGGDSIKAIQIVSRIRRFELKLQVNHILKYPTIGELSKYVELGTYVEKQDMITGKVELTPIQKWFFEQHYTNMNYFNQSLMLYRREGFDQEIVNKVFEKIVEHHDILRSIYKEVNGNVIQYVRDMNEKPFLFNVYDYRAQEDCIKEIEEEVETLQCNINLYKGPLVNIGLFKTREGDHLLIIIHHLIIDGVSWRILLEDFACGYRQAIKQEEIRLPQKTMSYRKWVNALKAYADSKICKVESEYWTSIENAVISPLKKDNLVYKRLVKDNKSITMMLTQEETVKLARKANTAYNTDINDILLAALVSVLYKWTGEQRLIINLEGHGREIIDNTDVTRTVGWFTTLYPVIFDIAYTEDLGQQLKLVKETLRAVPRKGIGYGILKYMSLRESNTGLQFGLRPEINFNYLGQFDNEIKTDIFDLSNISSGTNINPEMETSFAININGMIINEQLSLDFTYNINEYNECTIKDLATGYKEELLNIVEHCISREMAEITPSDISTNIFSISELDEVFDVFEKEFSKE